MKMNGVLPLQFALLLVIQIFIAFPKSAHTQLRNADSTIFYLNPKWSPDGKRLAFASDFEGKLSVYTINSTGTGTRRITDGISESGLPNWSPDGRSLVYQKTVEGDLLKLFIYSFNSRKEIQVTQSVTIDYGASWSSANRLCFNSRKDKNAFNHDICFLDIASRNLNKITNSQFDYSGPCWSPDGKNLVCIKSILMNKSFAESTREEINETRNSSEIVLLKGDGFNISKLTNDSFPNRCPSFSKSGQFIYYISQEYSISKIIQYNLKTGNKQTLFTTPEMLTNFSVSPDEKYIAYSIKRGGMYGIFIWDMVGRKERLLIGK